MIRRLLRRFLPRIAVAVDPGSQPRGTWVFAPRRRAVAGCGLAGILEIAGAAPWEGPSADDLERRVSAATAVSASGLPEDPAALEHYAGGSSAPAALLAAAHALRRPGALAAGAALPALEAAAADAADRLDAFCTAEERVLESVAARLASSDQEAVAARLVLLRDAAWSLRSEFLGALARTRDLAGPDASPRLLRELRKVDGVLDAVDRIEVRGRDSAGLVIHVALPSRAAADAFRADLAAAGLAEELERRGAVVDLLDGALTVSEPDGDDRPVAFGFVRKVAAEVGALGDNVAALRTRIREDGILRRALAREDAVVVVLGHTRWASNGIIHEANAHPVDNATVPAEGAGPETLPIPDVAHPVYGRTRGRVFVALNGDVDNHLELHAAHAAATGRHGSPTVTTDTKVIALGIDRGLSDGLDLEAAFRRAVGKLEGSAAIGMVSDLEPGRIFLSLRGSGQSLYVGLAPDAFVLSSEVYGLVHATSRYVALEGETERVPGDRDSRGSIAVLDVAAAVGEPRITGFDGTVLEGDAVRRRTAEITTRDVHRGDFPHFFRKEIDQSPESVARTLRGKFDLSGDDGRRLDLNLGEEILPAALEARLRSGAIRRIVCVGQGTAAVAGRAIAALLRADLAAAPVTVEDTQASELSGFGLREDMSDTLVLAVTQSGSTADTNRAVDLARRRGAAVIAIVNRRSSDITRRADGVFYTSDGRDVEMSVASTKAFHAQVAAGAVLALALARALGCDGGGVLAERARELRGLPDLLRAVLALDADIAAVASAAAPTRRHWTIVGSGLNRVAAEEIRIKCSELCYKSIAADTVEDKKHIDLSAEALMVVLAAGNPETVQGDLAKDVAIFHAHKGLPVVFADADDTRYDPYAAHVVRLPAAPPRLALLANVMAGHLFAYHAARAIDEGARFLARVRSAVLAALGKGGGRAAPDVMGDAIDAALERLRAGRFDSALSGSGAARLALLLEAAAGRLAPAAVGATPDDLVDRVVEGLTEAVRELERPVDAIRHQAKIVTVGTSRTVARPEGPVFDALDAAGVSLDAVPPLALATLRSIGPALAAVEGWARYRVEGLGPGGAPVATTTHVIEERGGISADLPSRAVGGAPLRGTKRGVVAHRRVFVGIGGKDGRTLVIVPLLDASLRCTAIVLLHVAFRDTMSVAEKAGVLGAAGLDPLVNGVTEVDVPWTDDLLEPVSPRDLLTLPPDRLVDRILQGVRDA